MWETVTEELRPGALRRHTLHVGGAPLPLCFREVIELWESDPAFRSWFTALLAGEPMEAYFWETPPLTRATFDRPFECVLVEGGILATLPPDPRPFADPFAAEPASKDVIAFPNLGGDARLVVPRPRAAPEVYLHLASFLRGAPETQPDEFWRLAAIELRKSLCEEPRWLSTAGLGVAWLHLRIDSRPKYYRFSPYARFP